MRRRPADPPDIENLDSIPGIGLAGARSCRGRQRALIAVMHKLARAIWHILRNKPRYQDLGPDCVTRPDPERAMHRMTKEANRLGLTVRFERITATA